MFSSIMVPEEVRRLFQVLTGEDMTDADEGLLFAVADALESGAAGLGEVRALVAELVGKVRTEFSGKAADRFAGGLAVFDGLLSSGEAALRELAVFMRYLAQQVRYLKLVTIYGLELLLLEMAWAMQFAGATAGASLLWLAARMAVMRMLLSRWWGQLFMRLATAAAGGVTFNVMPDVQAQLQMVGEGFQWDGTLTAQSAGMGAFSALVSLPLSALGGLVSNTLTKVLVKGLGDDVDAAILEAAAKKAVAEHAELYPVSAMAKFADAVGKSLDDYAGMSVGAMWLARFGHSVGDAVAGSLSELFGEAFYQLLQGGPLTWNPYSLSAGGFETVFSGLGTLAGLALRGKLHPEGPSPYLEDTGGGGGGSDDGGGSGGEKTPLLGIGSRSQTGDFPGSPGKDSTSDFSDGSDVHSVISGSDTGSVDSAAVPVSSGDGLVVSGAGPAFGDMAGKDGQGGTDRKGGAEGSMPGGKAARGVPMVPGSGQDRPGAPPPAHSDEVAGSGQDQPGAPPPAYRPVAGGDPVPGVHGVDAPGNRPLEVPTLPTADSPAVTPHAFGAPADTTLPETGRSVSVVDSDGGVPAGALLAKGMTGRHGNSGVDSLAGQMVSHRQDVAVVSPDSATPSVEGSPTAPYLQQNPAAVLPAGLPADTVRVPVPTDVVARGGLAEFVQGGVTDSRGGPVVLVSQGNPNAGAVVSPGQGSALAQGMGRNVVAMTSEQGGREPQWTVFGPDGSARPVAGDAQLAATTTRGVGADTTWGERTESPGRTSGSEERVSASSVGSGTNPEPLQESYRVALSELAGADLDRQREASARADSILGPTLQEYRVARVLMAHQYLRFPDDESAAVERRVELQRQMIRLMHIGAGAGPEPGGNGLSPSTGSAGSKSTEDVVDDTKSIDCDAGTFGRPSPEPDAEPSPGTSAANAHVLDEVTDDAESDFAKFEESLRRLRRLGEDGPSRSPVRAVESVVDDDAVSAGENGPRRSQTWTGVGRNQDDSADNGARSLWGSSGSDTDSGSLVDSADRTGQSDRTVLTDPTEPSERTDGVAPPGDSSHDSKPPDETAGVRERVDGVDARQDGSRLRIPRDLRRSDWLGTAPQIVQTVGADRVVEAVRGLVPEGTEPVGIDAVEHAVLNEVRSLRRGGRKFKVGGVRVLVQAKFDWRGSEAVEGNATEQSATWTADHKAGASNAFSHRPRYRQIFFMPAVPGLFALGAMELPTGLASHRATSHTDTHGQSVRIALPERATPGGDSEYAGARPVFVPVTFRVSRVDADGHSTGPVTIVGGRDRPDAGPVGTTLSVPEGLQPMTRARVVPMPGELPVSVLEGATVRGSTRGWYRGKPLPAKTTRSGEPPGIYDQMAAQLGSLDEDSREALQEFVSQGNVERLLPEMRVSEHAAAAGRGWVTLETPLRSGNSFRRLFSSRSQGVQMRAVAKRVGYLETMDNARWESASAGGADAVNVHGSGRAGEGSGASGPGVDVGMVTAAAGPFAAAGAGRSRDQEFTTSAKADDTASRTVQIVRYHTVYDLQVRLPGRSSPITFHDAIDGVHWTPSESAREAGLLGEDGQPDPNGVAGITRMALASSGAGAKLARILRDSAHKVPGHHRWAWRDTDLVIDFGDPKLVKGIPGKAQEQLARGNEIDGALAGTHLSSPRVVEDMLTDQAASIEMVEHGRGHDYHVSLKVTAEVAEVRDLGAVGETDTGVRISESESAKHSRGVTWRAGVGFVARVYTLLAGNFSLVTSYHKFGFERGTSSHVGEDISLSFGGDRGTQPTATGGVGAQPRKRLAYRVRYTVSGTHWQEWNQLVKGVTIGRPGMHTPTVEKLPIVDASALEEGRGAGVVETDIVVELPAWQADQFKAQLEQLRSAAVTPVEHTVVSYDEETMRQGLSRVFDGMPVVSLHGLKHLRESAYRQLRALSGHSVWELGGNGNLIDRGISLHAVRATARAFSKKFRVDGLSVEKRRQDQHGVVECSFMMKNPVPVLDGDGNPVKIWERPTRSVTGGRTTGSSKSGTFSWMNSIEPAMAAVDDHTGVISGVLMQELSPGSGSYRRERGHTTDSGRTRSETGKPRELHLVTVDLEATVGAEVKTVGKIDKIGLFKGKPPARSAERFTLPESATVLVDDRQLQEIKTRQAELQAQRAHEAGKEPVVTSIGLLEAPKDVAKVPAGLLEAPKDVAKVPAGHTLATPSWSRGVTEPVDLSDRIPLLREQISQRLGREAAEGLLPVFPQDTPLGNDRTAGHFLSNVQAKLGDLDNGGAGTQLRWEGRWRGHTYELHVGAELLGEPEADGIKHGGLATASVASITASKIRGGSRVLLEVMTGAIPGVLLRGTDSPGTAGLAGSESIPQHGPGFGRLGLGILHVAEWRKQVRSRTQTPTTSYTSSETVSGALASHRAEVIFDVRIERHGERLAEAPDVRTVGVSTAVEDTLPEDLAQRSRAAEITDLTASQATDEAIQRWKTDHDAEVLPGAKEFRAVEFRGRVEDLIAAAEHAITSAGGSVTAEARRSLRAWFTPHRLEALLCPLTDPEHTPVPVELPPGLGVNLELYLKIPDRGALSSTSGRIMLDGSATNRSPDEHQAGSASGHAVLATPLFASGVLHPEGAKTYEEGRHEFGQVGDWNIPLISRGGHESETEHHTKSETARETISQESLDSPLKDITSTWLHGAEFRMLATPAEHSFGKRRAGVSATFEAGYVIRRSDRSGELPAGLVAATKEFAERDQEWTSASDQQRAARVHLSQATQVRQRADREELPEAQAHMQTTQQAWDEADTRARHAEHKWWQAKRDYETQLVRARTDPGLAGAPADANLTIREDSRTRVHNRYALFPVARKAVDATREGRRPRARYVVRGNLDRKANGASQAGQDFFIVAQGLESMLDLAQHDRPRESRFGVNDAGLIAPPQFLHAEGPTRVDIWIEPGPLVRDPAESAVSPDGLGWTREDLRREAEQSKPVFSTLSALAQESLRWQAEAVLARDHDFRALDGRTADEVLALHNDMAAVLARPLAQHDQGLADELSRNLAHEFHTARPTSTRPSPKPDTARTVQTPNNGPATSADRPGPSYVTAKSGLEPIQEEQPKPDDASALRFLSFW
ncbi:hypothetical protein [Saccharopolyspora hattusasensis]|uniref:WXG100-like domain-containing protein n=1 Tax=Saccharopolyspora hattusasensis TaxID=1128679 RepID=UPI003D98E018